MDRAWTIEPSYRCDMDDTARTGRLGLGKLTFVLAAVRRETLRNHTSRNVNNEELAIDISPQVQKSRLY